MAQQQRQQPAELELPSDLAAEQGVLGGLLSLPAAMDLVADKLTPASFRDRRHAAIYAAARAIHQAGEPIDQTTVASRLAQAGQLEMAGGAAFLADLADMVLAPANVEHYADLVVRAEQAAAFCRVCQDGFMRVARANGDRAQVMEQVEGELFAVAHAREAGGLAKLAKAVIGALSALEKRRPAGIKTGFPDLDKIVLGLCPGDLVIVAGRPSMGKTALALRFGSNAAIGGHPVALFSLEMSQEQLGQRLLADRAKVPLQRIRQSEALDMYDWDGLTRAADDLALLPLQIDDSPALTVAQIRSRARRMKAQGGLDLVLVDYLQLMRGEGHKREEEISSISRGLKALAKELGVPVVALSQLSREVEKRPDKRPIMSDLRESGAIEQDADVIIFLYRKRAYKRKDEPFEDGDDLAEVIVGKQRNGPTGLVKLRFSEQFTRFENL